VKKAIIYFSVFISTSVFSQEHAGLKLWYHQPSGEVWENALPIGNGRLGAMVYGNVATEIIQLNEHTVWSGGPNENNNPEALASLPEIRRLIFEGKQKEAEQLAANTIQTKKSNGQMFLPVGNLMITFNGHDDYTDFKRELDIENAVARSSYKVNGITFERESFASIPDQVIVIQLTASKPHSISFAAHLSTPQPDAKIKTTPNKELAITGTTIDHEGVKGIVKFKGIVRVKTEEGRLISNDTSLLVTNANSATIYISIATNFNN
jgi:alpha-L-fucosidase 2